MTRLASEVGGHRATGDSVTFRETFLITLMQIIIRSYKHLFFRWVRPLQLTINSWFWIIYFVLGHQASSHNFLSVIFGILRKFGIGICGRKFSRRKKFDRKKFDRKINKNKSVNFWCLYSIVNCSGTRGILTHRKNNCLNVLAYCV